MLGYETPSEHLEQESPQLYTSLILLFNILYVCGLINMKSINKSTFSTEDLVHELVENRKCAIVTGAAGTGKSFVIRKLQEVYGETELLSCAPTGTAAKNI